MNRITAALVAAVAVLAALLVAAPAQAATFTQSRCMPRVGCSVAQFRNCHTGMTAQGYRYLWCGPWYTRNAR